MTDFSSAKYKKKLKLDDAIAKNTGMDANMNIQSEKNMKSYKVWTTRVSSVWTMDFDSLRSGHTLEPHQMELSRPLVMELGFVG